MTRGRHDGLDIPQGGQYLRECHLNRVALDGLASVHGDRYVDTDGVQDLEDHLDIDGMVLGKQDVCATMPGATRRRPPWRSGSGSDHVRAASAP